MSSITLEIDVKHAHVFKNINLFTKMHLYTIVSLTRNGVTLKRSSTTVDKQGNSRPFWWSKIKFQIQENQLYESDVTLVFWVMCKQKLKGDVNVGRVYLPVKDIFEYYFSPSKRSKNGAYAICSSRLEKTRGVLYLSYFLDFGDQNYGAIPSLARELSMSLARELSIPSAPHVDDMDNEYESRMNIHGGYDYSRPIPSAPCLI